MNTWNGPDTVTGGRASVGAEAATCDVPTVRASADIPPADSRTATPPTTLDDPRAIAAGWAVLMVRRDDRVSRQVYLSLHTAIRALKRAEASGRDARMVLVELVPATHAPVYLLGGDDR